MLPCLSGYAYGTWRSKKVGGLKSLYGRKLEEGEKEGTK